MASLILGEQRFFEETLPISELKALLDGFAMASPRGQVSPRCSPRPRASAT
jgi:hypothetical protein